jgi:hypothetical protein
MRNFLVLAVFLSCAIFDLAFAGTVIRGLHPDELPTPEKCASCHNVARNYEEMSQSKHKDLRCLDCHVPGRVQQKKYDEKDVSFYRLGYHEQGDRWVETDENEVCLRCHKEKGISDTGEKCWSCHMPKDGIDELVLVKDKTLPPTGDNIRAIKKLPHVVHSVKIHPKASHAKGGK